MSVTTNKVIQKILKEVQHASNEQSNQNEMMKHIANVKLLCELLLEEDSPQVVDHGNEITADELKAMMGKTNQPSISKKRSDHDTINHDGANGDSLFDF